MTQFHEGQEVEVRSLDSDGTIGRAFSLFGWRKAKIVERGPEVLSSMYCVQFADGMCAVFDAKHIRADNYDPDGSIAARSNILGTDR